MRQRLAIAVIAGLVIVGLQMGRAGGPEPGAQLVSVYRWQIPAGWFGGFSGLELSPDGTRMVAMSDRGLFVQARLVRDNGTITDVTDVVQKRILNEQGHFAHGTGQRDSEGLAQLPNGELIVSFEGDHRVERFSRPGASAQHMPWARALSDMKPNGGFEALAVDAAGRLYAFPEAPIGPPDRLHGYRLEGDTWRQRFVVKRDKQFQPVGADFGPDGRLYLLERGFNGLGFRMRVRSFAVSGNALTDEKLLVRKGIGTSDNLEALSVWRDSQGKIRLTMISDDNFRLLQRTEIVEYVLRETS